MSPRLLGFVAEVIRESSQTSPADEVLRRKLKVATGLAGRDGSEASRAVFAYYRWLGWLDPKQVIGVQIERALELAAAFRKKPETFSDQEILERTLYSLVNEGATILAEGIALRAVDIDIIYVTGYGFPAHRGGPMFYADAVGLGKVYERICELKKQHGYWWRPAPLLKRLAASGGKFSD